MSHLVRHVLLVVLALVVSACGSGPARMTCDRSTCATGCCTADGRCEAGTQTTACGTSGAFCQMCLTGQLCQSGLCIGTGFGGGSATTGGGTAMGGGDAGGTTMGGGSVTGGGTAMGGGSATAGGSAGRVGCNGMSYAEALPTTANLGGLAFSSAMAQSYLISALELRYPFGKSVVEGGLANPISPQQSNCVTAFIRDTSTATAVLRQASTVVHECGHFWDLGTSRGSSSNYVIAPGLTRACNRGDTTTRGGSTFARSLIKSDAFYSMRPACMNMSSANCDFYADIYLDGSPTNATFESGDQGFNSLLEEANQYVNSLASALAFRDSFQNTRVSERDGILTFMWYLERYLLLARTSYPQAYATLSQDACWREAILSVWDRGWFYLQATAPFASNLGISDARLRTLVETPSLLAEVDALRRLQCP